jgi:c(7)-type cytochrome triheme protein
MSRIESLKARTVLGCAGVLFATALAASSGPRLRDGIVLPQSGDSPGRVLFNHSTHVDDARPDCTVCHPRPFSILPAGQRRVAGGRGQKGPVIVHAAMEKGEHCGACHDGKRAFALEDDCTSCHQ